MIISEDWKVNRGRVIFIQMVLNKLLKNKKITSDQYHIAKEKLKQLDNETFSQFSGSEKQ